MEYIGNTFEQVMDHSILGAAELPHNRHMDLLATLDNLTFTVENGLAGMGLTDQQSKIYVFLAKKGARKASEVARMLNLPRTHTYNLLNSLQKKGLVSCTMNYPIRFVATPLDKAVKTLLDMEKQKLVSFESQSKQLLDAWSSIAHHEITDEEIEEEKFQILEGSNVIYGKIMEIVSSAQKDVMVMADSKQLNTLYHNDVTASLQSLAEKGVDIKLLTSSKPCTEILDELGKCKIKTPPSFNANLHYIVIDRTQLIFFRKEKDEKTPSAIWTNCESLVCCIVYLFEELWSRH
ncbi:MAG: sugar-specific transcriptional regulator TrmB [Candidatus Nitrosomirales archaeon]|jgi:sugar-specific transcriptional regulator TrmB